MNTQIQTFFETATDVSAIDKALAVETSLGGLTAANSNEPLLKIDQQSGTMLLGAENIELPPGTKFAVNPYSFERGMVKWQNRQKVSEVMAPIGVEFAAPNGDTEGHQPQISFTMTDLHDPSSVVKLCSSSMWSIKAFKSLLNAIKARPSVEYAAPIVALTPSNYVSRNYGRTVHEINFPVIDWLDPKTGATLRGDTVGKLEAPAAATAEAPDTARAQKRTKAVND